MAERLCIFCCANFLPELAAAAGAWEDVAVAAFPARCGRPPIAWDELRPLLPAGCSQVVVLGRACLGGLGALPGDFPPTRIRPVDQCFHLVAGEQLVNEAITGGGYLVTPAWLADWRGQLKAMGFDPGQARDFFRDFARELVFFDTGLDPESRHRLAELEEATGLPGRRVAVGLDHVRPMLANVVLEWRLEAERRAAGERNRRHGAELADHVAAMDVLARLARTRHETEAIATIDELFQMLFAPAALHYLRVENGVPIAIRPIPEAMEADMRALATAYAWTRDDRGFLLRIQHGEETMGIVAVDGLAFPAYRERYLNMALAVAGVCGLAIENARNRRRLLDAEKMASLAIMVAGVAHEVNTPLGVGLAASSALQGKARELAERFAARTMTQSDLQAYLANAEAATRLIRDNLERIGHLVDAFRQVAVDGRVTDHGRFRFRACLEDALATFGERLSGDRVAVNIACDPALEVDSVAGDWASIFVNLIGNSLRHGFKGRAHGTIAIQVREEGARLRVEYADDGVGLAPASLARIFDPFFTTDLQQGMGLGMHLVYNLITHRFGGTIQCESRAGEGLRMHIDVPLRPHRETAP
ncbi:MAG: histidine kinase [Rhodocyclaceae bacterium]|nr:histidine kinase [Rhodocyclaceae bacterium]